MKRIRGLDQLRFILALWVLLPHCHLVPDFSGRPHTSLFALLLRGVADNLFNGVAAVIVFFVISGFCIHLPYRDQPRVALAPYFTRRFVRILIPMGAAFTLAIPLKLGFGLFSESILWSLLCEEVYYLLYPALRIAATRIGWKRLFYFAFGVAFILALTTYDTYDSTQGIYPAFGPRLTWLLGLPCWLLGCILAEKLNSFSVAVISSKQIWAWRTLVWFASWLCSVLKFHSALGYPLTLNFFAIFAFFWLQREIAYYRRRQPPRLWEKGGQWSYSMYLMHLHAEVVFVLIGLPPLFFPIGWLTNLGLVLSLCYLFYLVVERPSHRFARYLSKRIGHVPSALATELMEPSGLNGNDLALHPIPREAK